MLAVNNPPANVGRPKRLGFIPWVGKIPRRRAWQSTPVFLPGESQGQRSLAGYSPWGYKESDTTEVAKHACVCMHTHTHTHTHFVSLENPNTPLCSTSYSILPFIIHITLMY